MNKSLRKTLLLNKEKIVQSTKPLFIDGYNRAIKCDGISATITTRVSASNNTYVMIEKKEQEMNEIKCKQIHTLQGGKWDKVHESMRRVYSTDYLSPTITTCGGGQREPKIGVDMNEVKVIGNYMPSNHEASRIIDNKGIAPTIKENHGTVNATNTSDLRIRKLTPKECWRLMGQKDEDYEKAAQVNSQSQLYKQAWNSIVVQVLEHIFKEMMRE